MLDNAENEPDILQEAKKRHKIANQMLITEKMR
jgi:hypothetical protein